MASLGNKLFDYIHLHYDNYLNYGLSPSEDFPDKSEQSLTQRYRWLSKQIKKSTNSIDLKELENQLNYFTKNFSSDSEQENNMYIEIQQGVTEYMKTIVNSLEADDIDWEHFTLKPQAYNKLQNIQIKMPGLTTRTLKYGGLSNKKLISTFRKHLEEIKKYLEQLEKSKTKSELEIRVNNVEKELEQARKLSGSNRMPENLRPALGKEIDSIAREIIKASAVSTFEGAFNEAVLAAIVQSVTSGGKDGFETLLADLEKSTIVYKQGAYRSGITLAQEANRHYKEVEGEVGTWRLNMPVKGKIDVIFNPKDKKSLGISAKSYNFDKYDPRHKDISLVRGTPLDYLFQSQTHFFNHYLNQAVTSKDGQGVDVGPPKKVVDAANESMKKMLLLLGFTGGGLRTGNLSGAMAQIFQVKDKATGKVKIFNAAKLIDIIISRNLMSSANITDLKSWQNTYVDLKGAKVKNQTEKRIQQLYEQIHATKISVSIDRQAIGKMAGF